MGYVITYVTARPDLQKKSVLTWLLRHNFPFGPLYFCDTNITNFLSSKANTLKNIQKEVCLVNSFQLAKKKQDKGVKGLGFNRL